MFFPKSHMPARTWSVWYSQSLERCVPPCSKHSHSVTYLLGCATSITGLTALVTYFLSVMLCLLSALDNWDIFFKYHCCLPPPNLFPLPRVRSWHSYEPPWGTFSYSAGVRITALCLVCISWGLLPFSSHWTLKTLPCPLIVNLLKYRILEKGVENAQLEVEQWIPNSDCMRIAQGAY